MRIERHFGFGPLNFPRSVKLDVLRPIDAQPGKVSREGERWFEEGAVPVDHLVAAEYAARAFRHIDEACWLVSIGK